MVIDTDGAPNPRAIACASTTQGGSVDWAVRTAQAVVKLASALPGSARESGNGATTEASIAGSGRYEVFTSTATDLTGGTDDNGKADVFVRDLVSGATDLVSAATGGRFANGTSDQPIISDNGSPDVTAIHAIACRALRIRHRRTRPRRPQTNGKAERFIRTMLGGWAYGAIYASSRERTAALDGRLWTYNHRRRHSATGRQPPISHLNNVLGTYS